MPPVYEIEERRKRLKKEFEDFDAHAMNISGGNKPSKDSETKNTEKITKGEHVLTKLVSKEPISTTMRNDSELELIVDNNPLMYNPKTGQTALVVDVFIVDPINDPFDAGSEEDRFVNYISPHAYLDEETEIGENVFIFENWYVLPENYMILPDFH